jgi:hypothetical protein
MERGVEVIRGSALNPASKGGGGVLFASCQAIIIKIGDFVQFKRDKTRLIRG